MDNTINNYLIQSLYIKKMSMSPAMVKQEKWRQKQIKKYYYDGRPLFGKYEQKYYF